MFPFIFRATTYLGLLLIAVGSGGIKPCVSAFGGDQFQLPQQETYLASFFSFFYFAISTGSLLSIAIAPFLRADVTCFGETTCYPLVFFVPSVLMIISIGKFEAQFFLTSSLQCWKIRIYFCRNQILKVIYFFRGFLLWKKLIQDKKSNRQCHTKCGKMHDSEYFLKSKPFFFILKILIRQAKFFPN